MQDEPRPLIAICLPSAYAAQACAANAPAGNGASSPGNNSSEVVVYTWHNNYGAN